MQESGAASAPATFYFPLWEKQHLQGFQGFFFHSHISLWIRSAEADKNLNMCFSQITQILLNIFKSLLEQWAEVRGCYHFMWAC